MGCGTRARYHVPMKKLATDIQRLLATLTGDDEQARINLRANQVRERYKSAIESVYRDGAALFLAHTNNVYITMKDGVRTLIVYVDESIFAAELNAQRELIRLRLLELFGEDVEQFEIFVSRGPYKGNHPYLLDQDGAREEAPAAIPLDESERAFVAEAVASIEDRKLRETVQKAMTTDMEWKKGENRTRS